jgi:phosphoglucosamine mutase
MSRQLFGTDGIRGVAGEYPLDPLTVYCAGVALGRWASRHNRDEPLVLLGADPRESSHPIAGTIAAGLEAGGAIPRYAGVITTPGVAWLTKTDPFVAGAMISASHNPYHDNGIKVFDHSGFKLPDKDESALEREILSLRAQAPEVSRNSLTVEESLDERYLRRLAGLTSVRLDGLRLVVDAGNGAASRLGPELFRRLGARVQPIHCDPDGRNINDGCGALHVGSLRDAVLASGADLGVAFDGDADRAMLISRTGRVIDGDAVLLICARHLLERGALGGNHDGPMVVATVMSNLGLEKALERLGVRLLRTPVGDKYVLEEMIRSQASLGGEQSGHVIFGDVATTGDGMLTALRVVEIVRSSGRDLDALAADLTVYPQKLVNVRVKQRRPLEELPEVMAEIRAAERGLGGDGRVLVRFSGTEPLARVMVEGQVEEQVSALAARIAARIESALAG